MTLNPGYRPSDELRQELLGHGRRRLGAAVAPKELEFRPALPKTRSGKIKRRPLRSQELGEPSGDLSSLDNEDEA